MDKPEWLARVEAWFKSIAAIWTAIVTVVVGVFSTVVWLRAEQQRIAKVEAGEVAVAVLEAQKCVTFPTPEEMAMANLRHDAQDASPGELARVTWVMLHRQKQCQNLCVSASIVNGEGLDHHVETTIDRGNCIELSLQSGLNIAKSFGFRIPETAKPGCGRVVMKIRYGQEGNFKLSPPVPFTILNPDGSQPQETCA